MFNQFKILTILITYVLGSSVVIHYDLPFNNQIIMYIFMIVAATIYQLVLKQEHPIRIHIVVITNIQ